MDSSTDWSTKNIATAVKGVVTPATPVDTMDYPGCAFYLRREECCMLTMI